MTTQERFTTLYDNERIQRLIALRIRSYTRDPDRAEEISQRLWEKVWTKLLRDEREITPTWFWMVIYHCAIDTHKFLDGPDHLKHPVTFVPLMEDKPQQADGSDPEQIALRHEQVHMIVKAAGRLPALQREAVLCILHGEQPRECAARLGLSAQRVRQARRMGIEYIRRVLGTPRSQNVS